jgi:putative redox protein
MGTITLRWLEDHLMVGSDSHGHSVVIGRSPEPPNDWLGMKPSDLLLVAAAACSTWDVVEILAKQRQPLEDLKVVCSGEQNPDPPHAYTSINLHYVAHGAINADHLEKAIRLSEDKYCSVIASLRPGVVITSDFEIIL